MVEQSPVQIGNARRRHRFFGSTILSIARDPRGATAVEFAAIGPVLLVFLLGIMELGRALLTQNALHYAVEEAARCASINAVNCGTSSQIEAFAADSSGASFSGSVFTATTASCGNQVTASYPMTLNIPFMSYSFTLTAQSCYPA